MAVRQGLIPLRKAYRHELDAPAEGISHEPWWALNTAAVF